jgi:uncharacterized phage protein (TIGR02220 family)
MNNLWLSFDFFDNLKVRLLKIALGNDGIVGLQRLWVYAGKYAVDHLLDDDFIGVLKGFDEKTIELVAKWNGEPGAFFKVLNDHVFLEKKKGQWFIHDFLDNNPQLSVYIKQKINGSKYAKRRWERKNEEKKKSVCMGDLIGDPKGKPVGDLMGREGKVSKGNNKIPYDVILDDLNKKTGREGNKKFQLTDNTKKRIKDCWKSASKNPVYQDNPLEAFFYLADVMVVKWTGTEWEDYLRPSTLWQCTKHKDNFNKYLEYDLDKNKKGKQEKKDIKLFESLPSNMILYGKWVDRQELFDAIKEAGKDERRAIYKEVKKWKGMTPDQRDEAKLQARGKIPKKLKELIKVVGDE